MLRFGPFDCSIEFDECNYSSILEDLLPSLSVNVPLPQSLWVFFEWMQSQHADFREGDEEGQPLSLGVLNGG